MLRSQMSGGSTRVLSVLLFSRAQTHLLGCGGAFQSQGTMLPGTMLCTAVAHGRATGRTLAALRHAASARGPAS